MGKSAVAGILDKGGGLRVVVTQRWRMHNHVVGKERLFIVPDLLVEEPVPLADVPALIETVQTYVAKELAPTNHCGECRACCFIMHVSTEITGDKPTGQWCTHCSHATGCKIYWNRPQQCRNYVCGWLASQQRNDRMAPELRPDKCGAMFMDDSTTNDPLVIEVHGEPNQIAIDHINEMGRLGYKMRKIVRYLP